MKIPQLVVFDLDHTLLKGDSSELWAGEMARLGWIDDLDNFQAKHQLLMQTYATGNLDMSAYLALNLAPLKGRSYQEVAKAAEHFVNTELLDRVYQQGLDLIKRLRLEGHHLLMISASECFLVEPVAKALGFDGVIGIEPELDDHCFTGKALSPMSYQEGKIHHCRAYTEAMAMERWPIRFYSDSHNDIPLLEHADEPIAVKMGWPIIVFES